jgi:hypothetical protein
MLELIKWLTVAEGCCTRRIEAHRGSSGSTALQELNSAKNNSRLKQVARGKAVALIEARRAMQGKKSWILKIGFEFGR